MYTKITLTPIDKILVGKYLHDTENVCVLLDSTVMEFTVKLPDCICGNQFELIFKNIGTNTVRLQPVIGQYIDTSLYYDLTTWQSVRLWSDLNKRWLLVD